MSLKQKLDEGVSLRIPGGIVFQVEARAKALKYLAYNEVNVTRTKGTRWALLERVVGDEVRWTIENQFIGHCKDLGFYS